MDPRLTFSVLGRLVRVRLLLDAGCDVDRLVETHAKTTGLDAHKLAALERQAEVEAQDAGHAVDFGGKETTKHGSGVGATAISMTQWTALELRHNRMCEELGVEHPWKTPESANSRLDGYTAG